MSIFKHSFGNAQMPLSVETENCICSYSASFHQSLAPGFVGEALWMGPTAHLHPRNTHPVVEGLSGMCIMPKIKLK